MDDRHRCVQNALTQCMKGNEECLTTSAFQQYLNLGEDDARNYQTDFKVREYQCGPGKNSKTLFVLKRDTVTMKMER
uniref:Uncharacterized protein n=1 Tax=Panagrolaimus sp. ES5 TaxID=591445 RepID=A0AC34GSU1_9BILA